MSPESEFIQSEVADIARLFQDECWLESERRGSPVDHRDPIVQARVADIILSKMGIQLRAQHEHRQGPTKDSACQ